MLAVLAIVGLALLWSQPLQAQVQGKEWTAPQRLSSPGVENAGAVEMVPDQYGRLHLFWSEVSPEDEVSTIQYTVFDGEVWLEPVDIFVTPPRAEIVSYAADVDEQGTLHLVWVENSSGPVYYAKAPATDALSAHAWSAPVEISVSAYEVDLIVKQGVIHLLYTVYFADEPGVYYVRSEDNGASWSSPYWFDPDIPLNDAPFVIQFEPDDRNGLHVVWYYQILDIVSVPGHWVRYAHSLDGGKSWSDPFTIDVAESESDPMELRLPYPSLAVTGDQIHVVWAGTSDTEREHRYSLDRGETWTETERVMGNLHGQGLGGGFVKDAVGRLHYFAQIRWPQGVYHVVWDQDHWLSPSMIYLIARSDAEGRNGRYHAHNVRAGVRAGSQLVVTFTDEATGPLYVMYSTLEDIVPLPALPTPTPTAVATATPAPETTPTPVPVNAPGNTPVVSAPESSANFSTPIWLGVLPGALLLFFIILLRIIQQKIL